MVPLTEIYSPTAEDFRIAYQTNETERSSVVVTPGFGGPEVGGFRSFLSPITRKVDPALSKTAATPQLQMRGLETNQKPGPTVGVLTVPLKGSKYSIKCTDKTLALRPV